ncbi:hypothetical protein GCM10009830_33150 [Glycomyces endophyticus]|uniref:Uncharacterized protein n=1 Tax=Glycomyces endophyticus TaxID=480996 RepID=A0ABN2H7M4_9ACTN
MNEEIYVYEAIDAEPAITEAEVKTRIASGEYRKVTWEDDGRIGDGYFVQVGERGMLGIAMIPVLDNQGNLRHQGVAIQANPLDEDHRDATIEAELGKIIDDFGTAPDGIIRLFTGAIHIESGEGEDKLFVDGGKAVRART